MWLTSNSVQFLAPPPRGAKIIIERRTPYKESQVSWEDGTVLVASDMNTQAKQALFVLQENEQIVADAKQYRDEAEIIGASVLAHTTAAHAYALQAEIAEEQARGAKELAVSSANVASAAKEAVLAASAVLPWNAAETYNYPDMACCTDGHTYRCIGTNNLNDYPPESSLWVRITVIQAAGTYNMESGGTFGDAAVSAVSGGTF